MPMPEALRSHPFLSIWTVVIVIMITVEVRTGLSGIYPYVVGGATLVLILALTQAWIVDSLKLRRQRTPEAETSPE